MTIVCGTVFAPLSIPHCHDAAALARAEHGRLVLVRDSSGRVVVITGADDLIDGADPAQ